MDNQINKSKNQIIRIITILLLITTIIKYIEFLFIRTDQTIIADNVITKISCIIATLIAMKVCGLKLSDIGLKWKSTFKYIGCGFGLGIFTFAISYGLETLLLALQGKAPHLSLYITNFGLSGATSEVSLSAVAVIICVIVNIINVLAEEGMFRGFILQAVTDKWGFKTGNYVQALLFGIWHIVMCVLGVYDGQMSVAQAIVFAIGYVVLAGILAIEWGTCVSMTGVLWVGLSEHFFNNFIGNILHVVSTTGTDEFQIIRIVLSNFLSLGIVLFINRKRK
ncbi:MAG: CPBP family intramembrane metalloprotease [Lachnospiraceae bacterium]|nr:CPBP family intramembrane metalloprotease [Lachnospiraceae bacterium]